MNLNPILFLTIFFLVSCAHPKKYSVANRELGSDQVSRVGEKMVHIENQEDLKNAFGGSDIYGGKVSKGFTDVTYHGFDEKKKTFVFSIYVQEVKTNETTMTRYRQDRVAFNSNSTYNNWNNNLSTAYSNGSATIYRAPQAVRENLPPNTILVDLSYPKNDSFNIDKNYYIKVIKIAEDKSKIKFQLVKGQIADDF